MHYPRVIIDDERVHQDGGVHLRTSASGLEFLSSITDADSIGALYLDHDLGGDDTIRPVIVWLEEEAFNHRWLNIGTIYVHTANPVGADYIVKSNWLRRHGAPVVRIGLEKFL